MSDAIAAHLAEVSAAQREDRASNSGEHERILTALDDVRLKLASLPCQQHTDALQASRERLDRQETTLSVLQLADARRGGADGVRGVVSARTWKVALAFFGGIALLIAGGLLRGVTL